MPPHLDAAGGKLDANGGLGLEAELVAREPRQQIGLADTAVTNQYHLCTGGGNVGNALPSSNLGQSTLQTVRMQHRRQGYDAGCAEEQEDALKR